ncbi:MAG: hypothetical protein AAF658_19845, partial [Myxococcota bacterium]
GHYPDLPGCEAIALTPGELHPMLELERRDWIRERIADDRPIPFPNNHLAARPRRRYATVELHA